MKHHSIIWLLSLFIALPCGLATGCSSDELEGNADREALDPQLLTGLVPSIEGNLTATTRAAASDSDYVGRSQFIDNDIICLTTIQRTSYPSDKFSYHDLKWGLKSSLWSSADNQSVYWSDAASPHTFVGYSLPNASSDERWKKQQTESQTTYYGCLGDPADTEALDFTSTFKMEGNGAYVTDAYGNPIPEEGMDGAQKLQNEDLLLTYDTNLTATDGGSKALIKFRHALSQLCIEVYIGDFSAGVDAADNEAVVSNMVVKNQPVFYKWNENNLDYRDGVQGLTEEDQEALTTLFQNGGWNKRRDVKPWIRKPQGVGKGADKKYIYRMLAVPGLRSEDMVFTFDVTYPNPLKPSETKTAHYKAVLKAEAKLTLLPGKSTLIKIQLNHLEDTPTVGAEYVDWEFTPTPDRGELTKNATFLDTVEPSSVNLSSASNTHADNATWLFRDDGSNLVDRLGNDGSLTAPYKITTAAQLLAFALEVNGGIMDFKEKYVRLDASLVLQPIDSYMNAPNESTTLKWPGIGTSERPFQGTFFGGQASLSHLYGSPLFGCVGPNGWLEQVTLTDVLGITSGRGILADKNQGLFCACRVEGDITSSQEKVGGLAGENEGAILLSVHIGDVKGINEVGGIAGTNCGYIAASLHAGAVTATTEAESATVNGIAQNVKGTISVGEIGERNGKVDGSYYDKTLFPLGNDNQGKSTTEMQSKIFVDELNTYVNEKGNWSNLSNYLGDNHAYKGHYQYGQKHQFVYSPLQYPRIVNATSSSGGTQK